MNTNAISNIGASMDAASVYGKKNIVEKNVAGESKTTSFENEAAAVYEASGTDTVNNADLVEQLKADSLARQEQFRELVLQMFVKQGKISNTADIWKMLSSGNYTVDAATAQKASEDISEDGYWGVAQTSERIFDFARALAGDDSKKMQEMLEAFKKGFKQATEAWGKDLPDISQQTYDAVLKKFDNFLNESE